MSLHISSPDYRGVVAAWRRREAVQSRLKIDTTNAIIKTVKEAEEEARKTGEEDSDLEEEEQRTRFPQRVLRDFLAVDGGEDDPRTASSQHVYISQWYKDADAGIKKKAAKSKPKKEKKEKTPKGRSRRGEVESESSEEEDEEDAEEGKDKKLDPVLKAEADRLTEARKEYHRTKIGTAPPP